MASLKKMIYSLEYLEAEPLNSTVVVERQLCYPTRHISPTTSTNRSLLQPASALTLQTATTQSLSILVRKDGVVITVPLITSIPPVIHVLPTPQTWPPLPTTDPLPLW